MAVSCSLLLLLNSPPNGSISRYLHA